tara:strand:+ start:1584 stop:2180 length:597 start_codon:yes stop_codon:yes gene_type:complete
MLINPTLYKLCSSACGGLSILPLDVIQTKIMSTKKVEFNMNEFKWISLMPLVFVIQNTAYSKSYRINSQIIRGVIAGLVASPLYIFLEIKKYESRLKILPIMNKFIFWMTIREIVVYVTLYSIFTMNIPYAKFVAGFMANLLGFPLRIICMSKSYPIIKTDMNSIKKTGILEVIKSGLGDGLTLYLIYGFRYSPIKKN